jgi:hypothetical protein
VVDEEHAAPRRTRRARSCSGREQQAPPAAEKGEARHDDKQSRRTAGSGPPDPANGAEQPPRQPVGANGPGPASRRPRGRPRRTLRSSPGAVRRTWSRSSAVTATGTSTSRSWRPTGSRTPQGSARPAGRVIRRTRRRPPTVTADRGYGEAKVENELHELGVRTVVIPRKGRPGKARQAPEHRRAFRRTVISTLKRGYGWDRTRLDDLEGARSPGPQPGQGLSLRCMIDP